MAIKIVILAAYLLVVLVIGWFARTHWKSSPASYFLADRQLGTLILLATMTATNFSAFTVFGTSGAGYRDGWSFFPIMGFGTGFMALSFWVIGRKAWRIARERGLITPSELVRSLYDSPAVSLLFALVMIVFTVPYLALQPIAAGYALEELTGLPYFYGSLLVTAIIVLYTLHGALRVGKFFRALRRRFSRRVRTSEGPAAERACRSRRLQASRPECPPWRHSAARLPWPGWR